MDQVVENWIILLDNTKSMGKTDFSPNRFNNAIKAIKLFIEKKTQFDPDAFMSLFIFSTNTVVLSGLSQNSKDLLKQVSSKEFLKNHPPNGKSEEMFYAVKIAIETLKDRIQNIGSQFNRIFLLTDGDDEKVAVKIQSLIEKMNTLNIRVDIIIFSNLDHELSIEPYKKIANSTNGKLFLINTKKMLIEIISTFAQITNKQKGKIYVDVKKDKIRKEKLLEIAQNLRFWTEEEYEEVKKRSSTIKCQICFSRLSPINQISFFKTGRFCPNCDLALHLHCAGVWAKKTSEEKNLFRCPFCYTLLKLPKEILKGIEIKENNKSNNVQMIRVPIDKLNKNYYECSYCFRNIDHINDPEKKVFYCNQCNAKYHAECLKIMYDEGKICKNCGGKII